MSKDNVYYLHVFQNLERIADSIEKGEAEYSEIFKYLEKEEIKPSKFFKKVRSDYSSLLLESIHRKFMRGLTKIIAEQMSQNLLKIPSIEMGIKLKGKFEGIKLKDAPRLLSSYMGAEKTNIKKISEENVLVDGVERKLVTYEVTTKYRYDTCVWGSIPKSPKELEEVSKKGKHYLTEGICEPYLKGILLGVAGLDKDGAAASKTKVNSKECLLSGCPYCKYEFKIIE